MYKKKSYIQKIHSYWPRQGAWKCQDAWPSPELCPLPSVVPRNAGSGARGKAPDAGGRESRDVN